MGGMMTGKSKSYEKGKWELKEAQWKIFLKDITVIGVQFTNIYVYI